MVEVGLGLLSNVVLRAGHYLVVECLWQARGLWFDSLAPHKEYIYDKKKYIAQRC